MSGTTANLENTGGNFDNGNDSIVIVQCLESVPGGKTLDVTGYAPDLIKAGHVLIEETATGVIKPMPVTGSDYAALTAGHTYYGVVISTIPKTKPFAGILIRGSVNHAAMAYQPSAAILAAMKSALPLIRFVKD